MGESYQSAADEGTTKVFLLEEKRYLFYKYEDKSQFIQNLVFISSPSRVKCLVLELAIFRKLEKMQGRPLKRALENKVFTDRDYNHSLIYHNLLTISFLLV